MMNLSRKILTDKNVQSIGANALGALLNLFTFLILVRVLSKEAFGEWVIFATLATFVDLLRFGLTRRAIVHFSSKHHDSEKVIFRSSGAIIDSSVTVALVLLFVFIRVVFSEVSFGAYSLFFGYYPLLAVANLLWNNAISNLQTEQRFDRILVIRLVISGSFFLIILITSLFFSIDLVMVAWAFIISNLFGSMVVFTSLWDGFYNWARADRNSIKQLFNYGKYTLLTSVGSSLLRSADSLIIGLAPFLGAEWVAIYAIPFKIIDLVQLPLSGFMAVAIPRLSKAYINNQIDLFKNIFSTYLGAVSLLFMPILVVIGMLGEQFLLIFAGEQYLSSLGLMWLLLLIFIPYALLLPFDRLSGVALDAIERPDKNAVKVYVMLTLNLVGDLIAVFVFQSLILVAFTSVVFTIVGMVLGWHFLNKVVKIEIGSVFIRGIDFYRFELQKFLKGKISDVNTDKVRP
ncbi:hypothetical protein DMA11_07055 [Marinilabiliaceae bacterium JC017]|nr:hypothetical protein DMA11_07055 [Marinilabiliaceae bacterium JC017]